MSYYINDTMSINSDRYALDQRRIAAYLDKKTSAIDRLKGETEKLIADLEVYKKSLIFETVTRKKEC